MVKLAAWQAINCQQTVILLTEIEASGLQFAECTRFWVLNLPLSSRDYTNSMKPLLELVTALHSYWSYLLKYKAADLGVRHSNSSEAIPISPGSLARGVNCG